MCMLVWSVARRHERSSLAATTALQLADHWTGLRLRGRSILPYKDQLKPLLRKLKLIRGHRIQQRQIDPASYDNPFPPGAMFEAEWRRKAVKKSEEPQASQAQTSTLDALFFLYKNIVFQAQAEYSYFSADFGLKIFLYYSYYS